MLAFGTHMEEFHSFGEAFVTTLVVIATVTEDIYEMQFEIDPVVASIWHWLLVCIMYVVCLNLVLCILVDAYAQTQADRIQAEEEDMLLPSLLEQCADTAFYCYESSKEALQSAPKFLKRSTALEKVASLPDPSLPAKAAQAAFMMKVKQSGAQADVTKPKETSPKPAFAEAIQISAGPLSVDSSHEAGVVEDF